jgi:dipicolinate synthase subunit B
MEDLTKIIHEAIMDFKKRNYKLLSADERFIDENNRLTALAFRQILPATETAGKRILILGYGKLTRQIEKVITNADVHILNFNQSKQADLEKKYSERAHFETEGEILNTNVREFDIVINTIPKQVLNAGDFSPAQKIFELASPPYGIAGDVSNLSYQILPALPGKFYPKEATEAVLAHMQRQLNGTVNKKPTIVLCITGSSCSYLKLLPAITELVKEFNIIPVLSSNANLPNRFCDIEKFRADLADVCKNPVITTIAGAERLSANADIAASVVLPATGNTIAKLANAVTDTCVTMAVKALSRNSKPCVIGISTNDALSGNAANIGTLLNRKNFYFVPFGQDAIDSKPFSMVCDFSKISATIFAALDGRQLQPIIARI